MIAEGTPAERFAAEHAHYAPDLPFWTALADELGGPVVDLGAAVGRVTLPLARRGHDVVAVDGSPRMIAELRRALAIEPVNVGARVELVACDFRRLALGDRRFPLVVMPMNSLQALLTPEDRRACLRGVREHLAPGGVFAFDVVAQDLTAAAAAIGRELPGPTWSDPATGAHLAHSAWFDAVDVSSGTVAFTTRVRERDADGDVHEYLRPQTVHLFGPSELWELLHESGFAVQAVYGDFAGGPLTDESQHQVYRCAAAR